MTILAVLLFFLVAPALTILGVLVLVSGGIPKTQVRGRKRGWQLLGGSVVTGVLALILAGTSAPSNAPATATATSTTATATAAPSTSAVPAGFVAVPTTTTTTSAPAAPVTKATTAAEPKPAPVTTTKTSRPAPATTTTTKSAPTYASCADARAAGLSDIPSSSSAYNSDWDLDGDGIACESTTTAPHTSTKAPATTHAPESTDDDDSASSGSSSASYPNCAAVKAAGAAPLHRGDAGYSTKLDRDGDGIACEN